MEQPVGAALSREISPEEFERVEKGEQSIDSYIRRRTKEGTGSLGTEEWEASSRRLEERRAAESRMRWAEYHRAAIVRHQIVLTDLIHHHEREAAKYEAQMIEEGKGAA